MASPLFTNNAAVFLTTPVVAAATSITLPSGQGALFPNPSGGDWFMLTLENIGLGRREIVKVTARATDTLTVTRAQEGTTAQDFPATTSVAAHRLTAGTLTAIAAALSSGYTLPVADATTLGGVKDGAGVSIDGTGVLSVDVPVPAPASHALQPLRANAGATAVEYYAPPYDLALFIESVMTNNEEVLRYVAPRAFSLPAGATGSYAKAGTAATGSTTLTLYKNGVSFGTIVFAAAGTTGTITIASTTSFAAGDVLTVVGPATADTTLALVAVTLAGSRI